MKTPQTSGHLHVILTILALAAGFAARPAHAVIITVPSTSNPWLAGMPDGSTDFGLDFAPGHSPRRNFSCTPRFTFFARRMI